MAACCHTCGRRRSESRRAKAARESDACGRSAVALPASDSAQVRPGELAARSGARPPECGTSTRPAVPRAYSRSRRASADAARPCAGSRSVARSAARSRPRRSPSRSSRRRARETASTSRPAAFDVRASSTTPVTGASSRLTIPRYTLPGLLYFRRMYSFATASSDGRSSATPIVGSIAGLLTASR